MSTTAEDTTTTSEQTTESVPKHGQALKDALKKQLEYYFSKENLISDKFLLSQMNAEMYVPVKVIAGFKMIKTLTSNVDEVVAALRDMKSVTLDEKAENVRPSIKAQRNTIILRDIPTDTPVEEVKALFANEQCGKVVDIRSDVDNFWYVILEDDDTAINTVEYLRSQTFKGQSVKARIKPENTFRSLYASAFYAADQQQADQSGQYKTFPPAGQQWGDTPVTYASYNGYGYEGESNYRTYDSNRRGGYRRGGNKPPFGRGGSRGGGHSKGGQNLRESNSSQGAPARKRRESGGASSLPLGPAHFPPLPGASEKKTGYTAEFKKYSKEDIVGIISGMKLAKPSDLPTGSKIVIESPNTDVEVSKPWAKKLSESTSSAASLQSSASSIRDSSSSSLQQSQSSEPASTKTPDVTPQETAKSS